MIQFSRPATGVNQISTYLNFGDKMTDTSYRPLFSFTSQLSGTIINMLPFLADYTNINRYVSCPFFLGDTDIPVSGFFKFGTEDRPFGFYDVTVYQNSSAENLDPTGLTEIWTGLSNLSADEDFPAVQYNEYDTNDTDTESVYITF